MFDQRNKRIGKIGSIDAKTSMALTKKHERQERRRMFLSKSNSEQTNPVASSSHAECSLSEASLDDNEQSSNSTDEVSPAKRAKVDSPFLEPKHYHYQTDGSSKPAQTSQMRIKLPATALVCDRFRIPNV